MIRSPLSPRKGVPPYRRSSSASCHPECSNQPPAGSPLHLMGLDGMVSKHRETYIAAAGSGIGSRSKTGRIRRLAGFRISSETAPARVMRRFEVPEDNGFIAEPAPHALSHDGACADDVRADPRPSHRPAVGRVLGRLISTTVLEPLPPFERPAHRRLNSRPATLIGVSTTDCLTTSANSCGRGLMTSSPAVIAETFHIALVARRTAAGLRCSMRRSMHWWMFPTGAPVTGRRSISTASGARIVSSNRDLPRTNSQADITVKRALCITPIPLHSASAEPTVVLAVP